MHIRTLQNGLILTVLYGTFIFFLASFHGNSSGIGNNRPWHQNFMRMHIRIMNINGILMNINGKIEKKTMKYEYFYYISA